MTRFGYLSTYPPTRCGLATFTASLAEAMVDDTSAEARIVRVLDVPESPPSPDLPAPRIRVADHLIGGDHASIAGAATALNSCDIAIIQHEYGIYGGPDGDEILTVMTALRVPSIVVLHTVLPAPTDTQRDVLENVCRLASAVVVMTTAARDILSSGYRVSPYKVSVIAHGVAVWAAAHAPRDNRVQRVLTWGLIGPGKGLEWGIRAMAELRNSVPDATYTVVGQTHPKVLAHEGDIYRDRLNALIVKLGLSASVTLDAEYYDDLRLAATVATADVVLLPYDSRVQVTSGVLVEAIAAGTPVVATAFPHAIELLSAGAGTVVPHENPAAIATALREILHEPGVAQRMSAAATVSADGLKWAEIATQYRNLAARLLAARAA